MRPLRPDTELQSTSAHLVPLLPSPDWPRKLWPWPFPPEPVRDQANGGGAAVTTRSAMHEYYDVHACVQTTVRGLLRGRAYECIGVARPLPLHCTVPLACTYVFLHLLSYPEYFLRMPFPLIHSHFQLPPPVRLQRPVSIILAPSHSRSHKSYGKRDSVSLPT